METSVIGIAANNSYFYINNQLEPVHQSFYSNRKWYFIMGCMARISTYLTCFYRMDTSLMVRN